MHRTHRWILLPLILLTTLWAGDGQKESAPDEMPGFRAAIDPATGRFVEPSAPVRTDKLPADLLQRISTSDAGLREVPSTAPDGGVMVDLQGRFHSASVAVIDEASNLSAPCVVAPGDYQADSDE